LSKLSDKIRKCSRLEAQPLGFVTSTATKDATMVLVGLAKQAGDAADLARRGADAVCVDGSISGGTGDGPGRLVTGARVSDKVDGRALKEAGFDFALFDPDKTPSTAVLEEDIGYVIALPSDISDVELRAIESFQLDAIDVGRLDNALTVRRQIDLRRIFALTRKPLMARVPADISVDQLQALRDTNVIIVAAEGGDNIERLRKTIDALPPRTRRRDEERAMPVIPRSAPGHDEEHEHEDGD
jgi:hypothetical protein